MPIPAIDPIVINLVAPQRTAAPADYDDIADQWAADQVTLKNLYTTMIGQTNLVTADINAALNTVLEAVDTTSTATSLANFVGDWGDQTGAANIPYSAYHDGSIWVLLNDLADVTASEPGPGNADWYEIERNVYNVSTAAGVALDINEHRWFERTVAANTAFTFDNIPSAGGVIWIVVVEHTGGTISWPTAVTWPGDIEPTPETGYRHTFIFKTADGGTRIEGAPLTGYPL